MNIDMQLVNILLVEDDSVDVMNLKRAFSRNNITNPVYVAQDGLDALEKLRNGTFNPLPRIVLLDLNMPRMNGIEFLRELRKDEELKSLSVFVMTTSNEDKDKIDAYNLNVAGYIVKPISFEKFLAAVATLKTYWQLLEFPHSE
jgi:CheY-like chemotaxis protein